MSDNNTDRISFGITVVKVVIGLIVLAVLVYLLVITSPFYEKENNNSTTNKNYIFCSNNVKGLVNTTSLWSPIQSNGTFIVTNSEPTYSAITVPAGNYEFITTGGFMSSSDSSNVLLTIQYSFSYGWSETSASLNPSMNLVDTLPANDYFSTTATGFGTAIDGAVLTVLMSQSGATETDCTWGGSLIIKQV